MTFGPQMLSQALMLLRDVMDKPAMQAEAF